jgi:arylsulfatase A-like enzyme
MLGLQPLPGQHVDGKSIVPLLKGRKKIDRDAIYWHFPHYSNHGMQSPGGAVRYKNFKLIEYYENGTVQLFDLDKDIGELHDLAKEHPAKVNELRNMLHRWRESVGAKMMEPNPEGFTYDIPPGAKSGNH